MDKTEGAPGSIDPHLFKERFGQLEFVGDFDGLYKTTSDPWGQSGEGNSPMARYYHLSRGRILIALGHFGVPDKQRILEVGCGHGHALNCFRSAMPDGLEWTGWDISPTAIEGALAAEMARGRRPPITFAVRDITDERAADVRPLFDVVLFNQLLWYTLQRPNITLHNLRNLVAPGGMLVVSQAFLREQRYGLDIAPGFDGALSLFLNGLGGSFRLLEANCLYDGSLPHDDGLMIFRRK